MKIGALADAVGMSRDALRFYEKQGLIQSKRLANGYRDYDESEKEVIVLIKAAQDLGFTLTEVGEILPLLRGEDGLSSAVARDVAQQKLNNINNRMEALQQHKNRLTSLLLINTECPIKMACDVVKTHLDNWQSPSNT